MPTQPHPLCAIRNACPPGLICSFLSIARWWGAWEFRHAESYHQLDEFLPSFISTDGHRYGKSRPWPPLPRTLQTEGTQAPKCIPIVQVVGQVVKVRSRENKCDIIPGHEGVEYAELVRKPTGPGPGLREKQMAVESD